MNKFAYSGFKFNVNETGLMLTIECDIPGYELLVTEHHKTVLDLYARVLEITGYYKLTYSGLYIGSDHNLFNECFVGMSHNRKDQSFNFTYKGKAYTLPVADFRNLMSHKVRK